LTKKELARRILMLTMPWPLSRLFPSSIRIGLSLWPGDVKEVYAGPQGAAYIPGVGATKETVFMPLSAPAAPIFSDVVSWPSNVFSGEIIPSSIKGPSPIDPSSIQDLLDSSYWVDPENSNSHSFDGETGIMDIESDTILNATDELGDPGITDSLAIDFTGPDDIDSVTIVLRDDDLPAVETVGGCVDVGGYRITGTANETYLGAAGISFDHKAQITQVQFMLYSDNDVSSHTLHAALCTVSGTPDNYVLNVIARSTNNVSGDNTWNHEWIAFDFTPPALLASGVKYAIIITADIEDAWNVVNCDLNNAKIQNAYFTQWKTDKSIYIKETPRAPCIKILHQDLSGDTEIASFDNVIDGQKLEFASVSIKMIEIRIAYAGGGGGHIYVAGLDFNVTPG
jgi:hypothetical protein